MPKDSRCHSTWKSCLLRSCDAKYPALDAGYRALGGRQARLQQPRKLPGAVGLSESRRHREGVMLVGCPVMRRECVLPTRWVDLDDRRHPRGDPPTVEWPEVKAGAEQPAQIQQPGYSGMG